MTGVPSYSTTPAENVNANTGITWDEGMAPALVNNSARQNMTDTRSQWNDAAWFQYGAGSKTVAATYASATSVTFTGADATAYWEKGRRAKAVGSGTGTIYGRVSSSSYGGGATTVNFVWDSGSLSNEALTVYASTIPVTGSPGPFQKANRFYDGAVSDPTGTTSATYVMMGLGGSWALTPRTSGRIKIYATGRIANNTVTQDTFVLGKYGTGSAPANAAAVTGTSITTSEKRVTTKGAGGNLDDFSYYGEVGSLTVGTAYWFDLALKVTGGSGAISSLSAVVEEIPA